MIPILRQVPVRNLTLAIAILLSTLLSTPIIDQVQASKPKNARTPLTIERDAEKLPIQVAEMREAILAAALSGRIKELLVPIQWNELRPDFGTVDSSKPIPDFKKLSVDGEGREILAVLKQLLEMPYAIVRQGRDIENNKIYVWPYVAELPLQKLKPEQEVDLLQLIPRDSYKSMKKSGKYTYWRLAIGADGTWHEFLQSEP